MTTTTPPISAQDLRQRAEELFRASEALIPELTSPEEMNQILYELRVHQIELEMQNEELRRSQEELDASQARYFDLYDLAPVGYMTVSEKRMICEINLAAANMFKVARKSLVKEPVSRILHQNDQIIFYQQLIQCYTSSNPQDWEMRLVRSDGSAFWAHLQAAPASGGEYWITLIDITERKQTEDALRESREKYKASIDNSFDVIFSLTAEGTFLFVSRAWERHFGYSIREVIGKNFADFVHPDDIATLTKYLSKVIISGKSKTSPPYRVKRSDGTWRSFITNGSRYADTDNVWQFIGVAHDMTDQLEAEQDLLQAKADAEAANIAKSQFLSTMSHEIRSPMNGLLGMVQLLQQTKLTKEQREFTEIALQSGKKLVDLLNDILDLSKIEAGKIEPEIADFDLPSMISETVKILSLQSREKGVRLISSIDAELPTALNGDAGRLRQIIINLVGNAIKFTPRGSVTLHSQKDTEDDCSITIRFIISDSGIGIAADKLKQIFAPFTQANGTTTRRYGGTGLGLSICKRLVELMGGAIGVESLEGEGSTFWFTVVLGKKDFSPLPASPLRVKELETPSPSGGGLGRGSAIRILLTEDDIVAQRVLHGLLQKCGYSVDVASDGKEALRALEKNDYALVLMDCMMPEMSGYDVTSVIRDPASAVRRHDIPVIALTGNAMKEDRDHCLAFGMDDHLPKPLLLPDLLAMLEKWSNK